ncbi:MAG: methyltransferase domain-containing protein [Thermodesulfobacteriota bacterium]
MPYTIKESVVCNLCGADSYRLFLEKDGFNIVTCNNCGLTYVNPRPSDKDIKRLYQEEDYFKRDRDGIGYRDYFADEKLHINTFKRELNLIEKIKKGGSLLDVGCAAGFSLKVAKERGWRVYGVEMSKSASLYARDMFGVDVFNGTLEEAGYPDDHFDLITAYGTIEHTPDPLAFIKGVRRVLKEDGILVLATPDTGSWLGNRRFQYKPLEHLYYFNRHVITKMLKKADMEVFGVRKMKVYRSIRFLLERLRYYFKALAPIANTIESINRETKLFDLSLFIPDGQMVIYARKT